MTAKRALITWADDIEPVPVTWAWSGNLEWLYEDSEDSKGTGPESSASSGRIAAGTLAIAAGPEGVGKSSFGITLAALVSTGRLPGAWYGVPRKVLYVAVEDSWAHTLVPRLMAAEADLKRIGRFEVVSDADAVATLSLPHDNELFEKAISDHDVALVVLDPLMSLIGDRIDTHREREVREALDPLAKIADRTQAVILGIAHWNKSAGSDLSARITGSGAFKNVPRAIFGASLAELELELGRERRAAAREARRNRGQPIGRPKVLSEAQAALALRMHASGESAITIANTLKVSRATIYRALSVGGN